MTEANPAPFDNNAVWSGDRCTKDSFVKPLSDATLDAFDSLIDDVRGAEVETVTAEHLDFGRLENFLAAMATELRDGSGLVILQRFPDDRFSREDLALIHWCIGLYLGTAVSQSVLGDRLGHVVGVGGKDHRERAYRNSTELAMHTDACDIVGMMCLQKAIEGGVSGYVSGAAIYNEVLKRRPDLVSALETGFHYHRFGEEAPGESPVTEHPIPVFSSRDGYLSINYLRAYIDLAAQESGVQLSREQTEALDLVDDIAHSPEFAVSFMTEPGEAVFFNNFAVLHNRTAFEDSEQEDLKRHLLRLWLIAHNPTPKADVLDMYEGRGITEQSGRTSRLERDLEYREFASKQGQR